MITPEKLVEILENDAMYGTSTKKDHDYEAIKLLRERVPYEVLRSIIQGADHDIVYLPDPEEVAPYLSEEDAHELLALGIHIDESGGLAFFA